MCGIVGVFNTTNLDITSKIKFFSEALLVDSLRGHDSTGVFVVDKNQKDISIFKRAMDAPDFLAMNQYLSIKAAMRTANFIVGHNRAATQGALTHHNSHPFSHGKIVMVHNGTLTNHKSLKGGKSFSVDSEAFTYAMDVVGEKETLETVKGAFAVVWYNTDTGKLYMARNDERPLHYAFTSDGKSVLVASEALMIPWLASRKGTDLKLTSLKEVPVGKILCFDPKEVQKVEEEDFTPAVPSWEKYYHGNYRGSYKKERHKSNRKHFRSGSVTRETIKTRLQEHKLDYGDDVLFDEVAFSLYSKSSTTGKLSGLLIKDNAADSIEIEAHNVPAILYEEDATYCGKILGLRKGKALEEDILLLNNVELVSPIEPKETPKEEKHGGQYRGPKGIYVSRKVFEDLVSDGCAYCGKNINPLRSDEVSWIDVAQGGGAVCPECSTMLAGSGAIQH